MKKLAIKTILFIIITLVVLINYRFFTIHEDKFMVANMDKKETWSEIFDLTSEVKEAEFYVSPGEISLVDVNDYDYILVLYTDTGLYNIKATEYDVERVELLLNDRQVEIIEIKPLAFWVYGLVYLGVIIFPIMRKVE